MNIFDNQTLDIPCPLCGQKTTQTVGWLKTHDQMTCPSCSAVIRLEVEESLATIEKAEKSLADLRATLGKRR